MEHAPADCQKLVVKQTATSLKFQMISDVQKGLSQTGCSSVWGQVPNIHKSPGGCVVLLLTGFLRIWENVE
eukprot:2992330-Pleurochrysis_carterae.AAC.3